MKLCIFAGTFNPIHNAHIKMAEYVSDEFGFDKILFIPAYKPPHKDYDISYSQHRYNMVELAVTDNDKFDISDIEFNRDSKSYTYITIQNLYKKYDLDEKINFIIGTDAFSKIESWYETDKLKGLIEFIVFVRQNEKADFTGLMQKGYKFKFANMDFVDISSTEVRDKIKSNEDISDLVPKKVKEYIEKYGLYKN